MGVALKGIDVAVQQRKTFDTADWRGGLRRVAPMRRKKILWQSNSCKEKGGNPSPRRRRGVSAEGKGKTGSEGMRLSQREVETEVRKASFLLGRGFEVSKKKSAP